MAKRTAITRDLYEKLTIAFKECPGNASYAARACLVDERTARRGWKLGWKDKGFGPISSTLENEKVDAQAVARKAVMRAQEAAEADREASRQESIEAHKQELQMLKAARQDVLAVLLICNELIPSMRDVVQIVKDHLKPDPVTGKRPALAPQVALSLLTRHAMLMQKAVGATEAVIQLSRLERGASTVNVGIGVGVDEDLSMEQALEELEAVEEVLKGARGARGLVTGAKKVLLGRGASPT